MPRGALPGPDHHRWKGDEASVSAKHEWMNRNYPRTGVCEHCDEPKRTGYATKVPGVYTRDREDYLELCYKCHYLFDGVEQKGRTRSPETCAKISAGQKGKTINAKQRAALLAQARRSPSLETRAKMSASHAGGRHATSR